MWSVATALDSTDRYYIGDRSERQRLGWLDGLGTIHLPIQEYFAILMASNSYTGAEYKPCSVLYDRSMHKCIRKTLDDVTRSRFPSFLFRVLAEFRHTKSL